MKVLIVSTHDNSGGAALAAFRLKEALVQKNIDCQMLVQSKSTDDYRVNGPTTKIKKAFSQWRAIMDSLPLRLYKRRTKTLFSSGYLPFGGIVDQINKINPDIVHMHWIAGGLLRIEDIAKIKAPIVWSMHDMWAFTGGCHYDEDCGLYVKSCGTCKVLKSSSKYDLSYVNFKRKLATYKKIKNLHINASSKWITNAAKSSSLFKERAFSTLANPIDSKLFKPISKKLVRNIFNIPLDKKIVMFAALNPLGDPRKGYSQLQEALSVLDTENVELVVAGSSMPENPPEAKFPAHYIPILSDEYSLAMLYNVADVVVVPSIQENLANTVVESLMSGVPVVAFDIGGNPDMIHHKINGFLARPFDGQGLAEGINWILTHPSYEELSKAARLYAIENFSYEILSEKYIELYKKTILNDVNL